MMNEREKEEGRPPPSTFLVFFEGGETSLQSRFLRVWKGASDGPRSGLGKEEEEEEAFDLV